MSARECQHFLGVAAKGDVVEVETVAPGRYRAFLRKG